MMEEQHGLLAAFAHPDDECLGAGGTLAHYASAGVPVALVCATRGEVGEISDPGLATPENLGEVREEELRCACQAMGVSELVFLGYRDSGMAGTPENNNSRAFVNAPADEVTSRLVGIIRRLRPQVVITFEPNGNYGHPDHITIHRHTIAAFHAAADPARYPEHGPPWQAARLFYSVLPKSLIREMRQQMEVLGMDTRAFTERFKDREPGWPDEQVHLRFNVADIVEAKWTAFRCHRTQFGPDNIFRRLQEETVKKMISYEHFALAWPDPTPGLQLSHLFADL